MSTRPLKYDLGDSQHHLVCQRGVRLGTCGFRVHDQYYRDKSRFTPGICPNCGGVVVACSPWDDMPDASVRISGSSGRVERVEIT